MALFLVAAACSAGCGTDPPRSVVAFDIPPTDTGPTDTGPTDAPRADVVDAAAPTDIPVTPDVVATDVTDAGAPMDVPADAGATGLAAVRAGIGTSSTPVTINVALTDLVVTRVVPATPGVDGGVSANDPGGFFVQSGMTGPAIFVAVDPATLSPAPVAGDRVAFTATQGRVSGGARWITAVTGFSRAAQGVDLAALRQDVSAATDLVTGLGDYEHELLRVQGTVATAFASAGTGFESAQVTTAGVTTAMTNLRLRVATPLRMSLDLRAGCTFTVTAPLWRFNAQVQVHAWSMDDIANVTCPPVMDSGVTDAGTPDAAADAATDGSVEAGPTDSGVFAADVPSVDAGAEPTPTAVWVVRVGEGMASLTNQPTPVFIERVRIADGMSDGATIALPTMPMGANQAFSVSGSATSEGQLTRTNDRRFVVLAGYAATAGSTDGGSVVTSTAPRVIARVAADGTVNTATSLGAAFPGGNVRGAASAEGQTFWAFGQSTGTGGLVGAALGAMSSTPVIGTPTNVRYAALYDTALYGTVSQSGGYGVFRVSGTTGTLLAGFPTASGPSRYGFVAFDRDGTPGIDTIYQCDDGSTVNNGVGGVWKHTLGAGGMWTAAGPYNVGLSTGCRSITGFVDGANVTLLLTSGDSGNRIFRGTDTGAAPAMTMFTEIRRAATNTAFRGIALAPR